MKKHFTLSAADRRALSRLLQSQQAKQPRNLVSQTNYELPDTHDSYWALPPCETGLPAAQYTENG